MRESSHKKLECLFAWATFYSNGKTLAVPTLMDRTKFEKNKLLIEQLEKQINH